jgi:hypothetical protein
VAAGDVSGKDEEVGARRSSFDVLRAFAFAVGVASLAVSGYVVVARKDGTATAALVVAGVVLTFVALFGDRITTLKYGDVQINLAASFLVRAREARARGDVARESELVGAALTAAGVSSGLSAAVSVTSARRLHRDAVFNNLAALEGTTVEYSGKPVDGFAARDDRRVAVDVHPGPKSARKSIERFENLRRKGESRAAGLLVVVPEGKDSRLAEVASEAEKELRVPVHVVRWTQDDPPDELGEALGALLGRAR